METVFTIGNGAMCSRGVFEEGYPGAMPACFASTAVGRHARQLHRIGEHPAWGAWTSGPMASVSGLIAARFWVIIASSTCAPAPLTAGALAAAGGGASAGTDFERFINLADPHGGRCR
ncbi:MAG: hypothetical protein IPM84_21850 [Anaerolineae bacterium]|nr:hypothetical protein [Anaerolineae bacterium]